jgi:hypothetical protein
MTKTYPNPTDQFGHTQTHPEPDRSLRSMAKPTRNPIDPLLVGFGWVWEGCWFCRSVVLKTHPYGLLAVLDFGLLGDRWFGLLGDLQGFD